MTLINVPRSTTTPKNYHPLFIQFFALSIFVVFLILHSPVHFIQQWFEIISQGLFKGHYLTEEKLTYLLKNKNFLIQQYIVPFRSFFFFVGVLCIIYPLCNSLLVFYKENKTLIFNRPFITKVGVVFFFLLLTTFPLKLGLMASGYAQMSINPFGISDPSNQLYQRILMPVIAYYLQLQGPLFYHFFSLICTFVLLYSIAFFFEQKNIRLSSLELFSIGTSSFIITQLQSPGYIEQLAYIFLLLIFIIPTDTFSKQSILVLLLLSHEISALMIVIIAFYFFTKEEKWMSAAIITVYVFFWILSFGFNIQELLSVRNIGTVSGIEWVLKNPQLEILGVLISIKLLWVITAVALYYAKKEKIFLLLLIGAAFSFTLLGVDTSRLMGYVLLPVIFSYYIVKKNSLIPEQYLRNIVIVNIAIPSVYVGTNIGIVFFDGIYQMVFLGFLFR